ADLAHRHSKTGDAVHHAEDIMSLIAEEFRDRHRHLRRLPAHEWRFIGGRNHDDATGQALFAEFIDDEFLHLAAAFTDEPNDVDIKRGIAGDHRQQHRFADARCREDTHALAKAAGGESVQRPDAEIDLAADPGAGMGWRRIGADAASEAAGW